MIYLNNKNGKIVNILSKRPWEIALLSIVFILSLTVDQFASLGNVTNILIQISPVLLLAVGQAFVLLTGGIDLSQAAAVGAGSVLIFALTKFIGLPGALVSVLMIAVIYYSVISYIVTVPVGGLNPLIVTLATMYILIGIAIFCTGGTPLMDIPDSSKQVFDIINNGKILSIPNPFWICAVVLLLASLLLHRTTTGILIYAVGDNPTAAKAHGLSILLGRMGAYVVNGVLTFIACLLLTSRIYQGNPHLGEGLLFDSIGGAVLGGVSLAGGIGGVWYAVRGVFLIFFIQNALYLTDMDSSVRDIAVGILILIGFGLSLWRKGGT